MPDPVFDQTSSDTDELTGLPPIIDETPTEYSTGNATDPIDPLTGEQTDGTGYSNTSNGNQIAVLSNLDYSTTLNITNNYVIFQTDQSTVTNNYGVANGAADETTSQTPGSGSLRRSGYRYIISSNGSSRRNFKQRRVDRILSFSPSDGDTLALSRKRFRGIDKLDFTQVASRKDLKSAARGDFDVIYLEPRGELYFNQNGDARGFGRSGGLFAILETAPSISSEQFMLM